METKLTVFPTVKPLEWRDLTYEAAKPSPTRGGGDGHGHAGQAQRSRVGRFQPSLAEDAEVDARRNQADQTPVLEEAACSQSCGKGILMTPTQTKLLEDLRSGAVLASVKPLEWKIFCTQSGNCEAKTSFGAYVIQSESDGWVLYLLNEDDADGAFLSLEAAKAAAQADFEARILSALSPSPALVEMIEGLVRERDEAWADWSALPKDLYVTEVRTGDGIVFDVALCSVPMAIGPEVRYSRAETPRCEHCDGTGDAHSIDGEWRGYCACPAGVALAAEATCKQSLQVETIPRAANAGRYLAETNDGRLLYLNHAGEWQECPNFISRALTAEAERDALREALARLGEKKSRSLSFDGRTFCEDDNSDLWTVTEERGSRNDREWVVLGSGNTPTEALLNASTAARAPRRPAND